MKTAVILALCFVLFYVVYQDVFARYLPDDAQWYKLATASFLMLLPTSILINTPYYFSEMRLLRRAARPVPVETSVLRFPADCFHMARC